jgi:hypothetical protein
VCLRWLWRPTKVVQLPPPPTSVGQCVDSGDDKLVDVVLPLLMVKEVGLEYYGGASALP